MENKDINYFGKINFRGRNDVFGVKADDRTRHMYVIGKTGMGKTALLQNMTVQDVIHGNGVGVIDPHGDFAERILDFIPEHRIKDVVYFNPADSQFPVGLNLLEDVGYDERHLVASGLLGVFKKIWVDVWSARMEYLLNNAILALMEYPGSTLLDVNKMMTNKAFRREVMSHVQDPVVSEFWLEQFVNWGERLAGEATAAIENKVGQFTAAPLIRNIVGQKQSTIDFRDIMDNGRILVVNLAKGYIGEENSRLLGAMTITKLYLSAMSRVDIPENERRDFVLYVDEFQNFASEAFEGILSEARKYHLSLVLAHQYIEQMDEAVRNAVFGNIGTLISFRVGATDAEYLEKEFIPHFTIEDIVNLGKYHIILRLMIDGVGSMPFSGTTIEPFQPTHTSYREFIITESRKNWSVSREYIEEIIRERVAHLRKQQPAGQQQKGDSGQSQEQKLYDAVCSKCNKQTKIVFEPDGTKEVLCRKCRKKKKRRERDKEKRVQERVQQPQDTAQQNTTQPKQDRQDRQKPKQDEQEQSSHQPALASAPTPENPIQWTKSKPRKSKPAISLAELIEKYPPPQQAISKPPQVKDNATRHKELPEVDESAYTISRPPKERPKKEVDVEGLRSLLDDIVGENKKSKK